MARRITPSQFRSKLRQLEAKQRQAVRDINREIDSHNRKVKQAVNQYNSAVRAHNARVRSNQQRLKASLRQLQQTRQSQASSTFRVSVETVQTSYSRLEQRYETGQLDDRYNELLDLSEREAANTADVFVALNDTTQAEEPVSSEDQALIGRLAAMSTDYSDRWKGALFALKPENPDAARHFCSSSRELLTAIIERNAPDAQVFAMLPNCDKTRDDKPTRRSRISFFLRRKGMVDSSMIDFVNDDLENIVELFGIFNDGTHSGAGKYSLSQLRRIRRRVEDGLSFLFSVID